MPDEMFFFIADISGYTEYMVRNQMEHTHGIYLINELMTALVKEVALPMEVSKLEGDAIFLFLPYEKLPEEMHKDPRMLTEKILRFFTAFKRKINALQEKNVCDCGACANLGSLNIKIVAHFGKASIVKIGSFMELSGVDVILVHRLLKNQVKEKRYLLLTEAAYKKLSLPAEGKVVQAEEIDKDIGKIPVYIYYPPEGIPPPEKKELSFFEKIKGHAKLVLGTTLLKFGNKKNLHYHNFPK
ncbi:MAG: DUF2652 domain-containing protein [Verrucomicrobia bacterium]|nr:DUF2652 domain-containing protein [Verrucomicrobiota bacterium]